MLSDKLTDTVLFVKLAAKHRGQVTCAWRNGMRHLLLPRETDAYRREGERGREMRRRLKEGAQTLLTLNIFSLQGAGAEGPTAVSCNRTSLFVSAQGSLRAINGTQYPLCRELVSVSLETDKHIIHKCQTQCARSVTWWREAKGILGLECYSHSHALHWQYLGFHKEGGAQWTHPGTCWANCLALRRGSPQPAVPLWQTPNCIIFFNGYLRKEERLFARA